jgi:hypothetical protein
MFQIDPWEKAADCARALAAATEPRKREILTSIGNLWIALAGESRFLSEMELARQVEAIGRTHADLAESGCALVQ